MLMDLNQKYLVIVLGFGKDGSQKIVLPFCICSVHLPYGLSVSSACTSALRNIEFLMSAVIRSDAIFIYQVHLVKEKSLNRAMIALNVNGLASNICLNCSGLFQTQ